MAQNPKKILDALFRPLPKISGTYAVGGSIRDAMLGRPPVDFDVVVSGDAHRYARQLARKGHLVILGKKAHRLYRVFLEDRTVDIQPVSGPTIEADLLSRDFTINAMAYDLGSREFIDTVAAVDDLENGILRMVSEPAFNADPLRLIRAYRIAAELGFEIDDGTSLAITRHAGRLASVAGERIRHEWLRLLKSPLSWRYLQGMADSGLLFALFPELAALNACTQDKRHRFNVFGHTMAAYRHIESLLHPPRGSSASFAKSAGKATPPMRKALLKYSLLLHDIGKPAAKQVADGGIVHFHGHDKRGAQMAESICRRMKMSRVETGYICFLVARHLYPMMLHTEASKGVLTRKGRTRFFIKCGEKASDLLLLSLADRLGKDTRNGEDVEDFTRFVEKMLGRDEPLFRKAQKKPPLVTGRDLITQFGLSPSPVIGRILSCVEENRLSGQVTDRKAALDLAASCLKTFTQKGPAM